MRSDGEQAMRSGRNAGMVEAKHHDAIDNLNRERGNLGRSGIARALHGAAFQADPPVMQRTRDRGAADDAVGQWTAAMGASVLQREEAFAGVENGQLQRTDLNGAA